VNGRLTSLSSTAATLGAVAAALAVLGTPDPAITTVYPAPHPRGLMATSGGWVYCEQTLPIARRLGYTLICGRYYKDEYLGPGLRSRRHLDWGNPQYLTRFAAKIRAAHRQTRGDLILLGVSYAGFGVATLASHHPELRPAQLVVVDSYLDLPARRGKLSPSHETAREIDLETGGTPAALRSRSVSVAGLARLVRGGTRITAIWSVTAEERRSFGGATCDRTASAGILSRLARTLRRPISAWITRTEHGHDFRRYGTEIVRGHMPGTRVVFQAGGRIPRSSVC
jgi:hypothetical protein